MGDKNMVGAGAKGYASTPVLQALVKLVPGGSSLDTLLNARAKEIAAERQRVFFDELACGKIVWTESLVQSEDFIHAFHCTYRAAMMARHRAKTEKFARLLESTVAEDLHFEIDELEEQVAVLEEISEREFHALLTLFDAEQGNPRSLDENELQWVSRHWTKFKADVCKQLNMDESSFRGFMSRIERTGLYTQITGNYYDYEGGLGFTTPQFTKLLSRVQRKKHSSED